MNKHKKHQFYHAEGVEAQKREYSNDWKSLFRVFGVFRGFIVCFLRSMRVLAAEKHLFSVSVSSAVSTIYFPWKDLSPHFLHRTSHVRQAAPSSKRGAAIVELVLAMLLMMSMIVFSVFICRALSQRNRALAASRTVSWLYTHADKPEPEGVDDVWDSDEFSAEVSRWHFGDGSTPIISMTNQYGLIAKGKEILNVTTNRAMNAQDEDKIPATQTFFGIPSPKDFFSDCLGVFVDRSINWLTRGYKYNLSQVRVDTPLIFGPEAYQLFGWLEGEPSGKKRKMMTASFLSSCAMPIQEGGNGTADPFEPLVLKIQSVQGLLEKLVKDGQAKSQYRPLNQDEIPAGIDEKAFYALLVYEIDDPDQANQKVSPSGWESPSPFYHTASAMDTLLNAAKTGDYTDGRYRREFGY
jgi:hypothetical protein